MKLAGDHLRCLSRILGLTGICQYDHYVRCMLMGKTFPNVRVNRIGRSTINQYEPHFYLQIPLFHTEGQSRTMNIFHYRVYPFSPTKAVPYRFFFSGKDSWYINCSGWYGLYTSRAAFLLLLFISINCWSGSNSL